jgi:hypothetical protein
VEIIITNLGGYFPRLILASRFGRAAYTGINEVILSRAVHLLAERWG